MIELSKRLLTAASEVKEGARLADIGSDHAYLPIYLVEKDKISYALAGEVAKGPYNHAKEEVEKEGLCKSIDVRYGNGLEIINTADEINSVTICGMGGILIADILARGLEKGFIEGREQLVLQPNVAEEYLRNFLQKNNYRIQNEVIVEENGKIYEIINAIPADTPQTYTENEMKFGPVLMQKKSDVFIKKWTKELNTLEIILEQIKSSGKNKEVMIKEIHRKIDLIREVI